MASSLHANFYAYGYKLAPATATATARTMKILLVNPNTTEAVTASVEAEARRHAGPGTELTAVTAGFGVTIVSTEAENIVAAHAALDLLATHHAGFDAAIVAMSFDTGVAAARTVLPIPVVGITEAALHTACLMGRRFGLIVLGAVSLPLYTDLIDRLGLAGRLGAIEIADMRSAGDYLDRSTVTAAILAAATRLADAGTIDVIVVCGAAVAGIAQRLQTELAVPILDGVGPAVLQAELLVRLGRRPRRPPLRLASGQPTTGLGPALARLLEGPG